MGLTRIGGGGGGGGGVDSNMFSMLRTLLHTSYPLKGLLQNLEERLTFIASPGYESA